MVRTREATSLDRDAIRDLHLLAFPEGEGQAVASLATSLLSEETHPATFGLVAENEEKVIGHIGFSPVTLEGDKEWSGYILAPLGVDPERQRRGVGSALVERGIERLQTSGVNVLFVYGDPDYYGRFGFGGDVASTYSPPYELQYPHGWQALVFTGSVASSSRRRLSCVASLRDPGLW